MKRTIRILSVCLAVSLLCTVCLYAAPASSDGNIADKMSDAISEIESPLTISKERMERESAALIQYNDLIKGMQSITKSEDVYPESYGGAYINDNGDLVVCITESSDRASATEMVKTLTKNPDIETKVVKYSLNHLKQAQDEISDAMIEVSEQTRTKSLQKHSYYDLIKNISRVYTSETNNILVVGILDLSDDKIDKFNKAFPDINCVVFEEGPVNSTTTTQWRPGRKIYTSTEAWLSTGYPVYFTDSNGSTQKGFITAGHSFTSLSNAYTENNITPSNLLAVKVRSQFSGNADAALMKITNSEYEMSSVTHHLAVTLLQSYVVPSENMYVHKEGAKTGSTAGRVEACSVDITYGDVVIEDLIMTSALNLPGDSGGVMYNAAHHTILGSMSGTGHSSLSDEITAETFICSYVCGVYAATTTLNCTVWE